MRPAKSRVESAREGGNQGRGLGKISPHQSAYGRSVGAASASIGLSELVEAPQKSLGLTALHGNNDLNLSFKRRMPTSVIIERHSCGERRIQ